MGMPLRQWDVDVAPLLREIEAQAGWAEYHARRVKNICHLLKAKPNFDTRAKEEMDRALAELKSASALICETISMYESLPADE
jgi:hypothetical protein